MIGEKLVINALQTHQLGKRYGKHWALRNCTLQLPQGCIAGLIGLNGAGKTTLLHLVAGLLKPTEGSVEVLGISSLDTAALLPHIGFVSQERSLYRDFTINKMLALGKKLNSPWDEELAHSLVERLKLPCNRAIGKLSGGQQAQMAIIMALAKNPKLLLLDEPFAHVDPLAKHEISKILMEIAASRSLTLFISSHSIADLEQLCDHLVILDSSRVKLAGSIEQIMEQHKLLVGPSESFAIIAQSHTIIQASHTGRQSTVLEYTHEPQIHPAWEEQDLALETIVLAYLASQELSIPMLQELPFLKEVFQ